MLLAIGAVQHLTCSIVDAGSSHGVEDSRSRKHVQADSVERGYNESFSVGPEFNRAAEFARKAAEESASANAFSKEAYKRYAFTKTPVQYYQLPGLISV